MNHQRKRGNAVCIAWIALLFFCAALPVCAAPVICIDPGHSKATVGTRGRKLIEYQICWTMALKLKAELTKRGYAVVLAKPNRDVNTPTEDRARLASKVHAALFLRLHCDAGNESGIATFFPAQQGTALGTTGPAPAVLKASRQAAHLFHHDLIKTLHGALHNRGIRTDAQTAVGSKQGGALTGSIFSEVPVILVEMCVLQQKNDEAFLASPHGQNLLTRALADGVQAAAPLPDNEAK